jgi:hypothetical protein
MQGLVCQECRRCRWDAMVPYPRCVGRMGSSCETIMEVLTAVLDSERGIVSGIVRGIGL